MSFVRLPDSTTYTTAKIPSTSYDTGLAGYRISDTKFVYLRCGNCGLVESCHINRQYLFASTNWKEALWEWVTK